MTETKETHAVRFYSPGTFFNEESEREISSWDVVAACRMAQDIMERHNARPFAFRFFTRHETVVPPEMKDQFEPKLLKTAASPGRYYLGGEVRTYDGVLDQNDPQDRILLSNMHGNDWWVIIENTNSYKSMHVFAPEDVLVDPRTGDILKRGSEYDQYRAKMRAAKQSQIDAAW